MDEESSGSGGLAQAGAWLASRFGIAIDAVVDRELREIYAPNTQPVYGVGPTGQVYQLGRPAPAAQAPAPSLFTPQNLMLAAGAVLVLAFVLRR